MCFASVGVINTIRTISRTFSWIHKIDGLVQERRISSTLAMPLRLSCINPSKYCTAARKELSSWTYILNIQKVILSFLYIEGTKSHYDDVIMGAMASQITSQTIVYSNVYSDADQREHQSSVSLAFVLGIHRAPPVNSLHKWPVTRKMYPFDDVIILLFCVIISSGLGHETMVCAVYLSILLL